MTDEEIEREIQAKGLTAPRVTPQDIAANIVTEVYFTASQGFEGAHGGPANLASQIIAGTAFEPPEALKRLTFCVLVLRNGFTVTGENACVSPENFDAEMGRKIAKANAIEKVWPLMGYALKQRLAERSCETAPRG